MNLGDLVKVHEKGRSVFTIVAIDEDEGRAVIESAVDAPGKYPFPAPLAGLVRVEQ